MAVRRARVNMDVPVRTWRPRFRSQTQQTTTPSHAATVRAGITRMGETSAKVRVKYTVYIDLLCDENGRDTSQGSYIHPV
jgi:hypothetical protein